MDMMVFEIDESLQSNFHFIQRGTFMFVVNFFLFFLNTPIPLYKKSGGKHKMTGKHQITGKLNGGTAL